MVGSILLTLALFLPQQSTPLPDTAQGKQVEGYIQAFNSGDEATYLAMPEQRLHPEVLKKRTADERRQMYQRMKADFGRLRVAEVLKSTAEEIQLAVPDRRGPAPCSRSSSKGQRPSGSPGLRWRSTTADRRPRCADGGSQR